MLMPSVHYKTGATLCGRSRFYFPDSIPKLSRDHPEGMAKEKLGKWKGKTDAIADRQSLLRDTSAC